jgi:sodium-dependent phosphate cotransporter
MPVSFGAATARWVGWLKLPLFLFVLNVFFVSISLLGAFKGLGEGYGAALIKDLAQNPFVGLLLGILVTSIVQSSSTTTALVVALVAGGAFGEDHAAAIPLAIPVIMGANIGTSVTNLLVSMAHVGNRKEFERAFSCAVVHDFFNLLCVAIFLPLEVLTGLFSKVSLFLAESFAAVGGLKVVSPLKFLVSPQVGLVESIFQKPVAVEFLVNLIVAAMLFMGVAVLVRRVQAGLGQSLWVVGLLAVLSSLMIVLLRHFTEAVYSAPMATFLLGLVTLFGSLIGIVKIMRSVVVHRIETLFHDYVFKTATRALVVGMLVTAIVQSSSVTTSIIVPLAGAGILSIHQIYPYTLGANVGTTITAILAALSVGDIASVAVAFGHLLFNGLGLAIFLPLRRIPVSGALAFGRLAARARIVALVFVLGVFFIVPISLVMVFR